MRQLVVLLISLTPHSVHIKINPIWQLFHFDVRKIILICLRPKNLRRWHHWIFLNVVLSVDNDVLAILIHIIKLDLKPLIYCHFLILCLFFNSLDCMIYGVHPRHQVIRLRNLNRVLLIRVTTFYRSVIMTYWMAWTLFSGFPLIWVLVKELWRMHYLRKRLLVWLIVYRWQIFHVLKLDNRLWRIVGS